MHAAGSIAPAGGEAAGDMAAHDEPGAEVLGWSLWHSSNGADDVFVDFGGSEDRGSPAAAENEFNAPPPWYDEDVAVEFRDSAIFDDNFHAFLESVLGRLLQTPSGPALPRRVRSIWRL